MCSSNRLKLRIPLTLRRTTFPIRFNPPISRVAVPLGARIEIDLPGLMITREAGIVIWLEGFVKANPLITLYLFLLLPRSFDIMFISFAIFLAVFLVASGAETFTSFSVSYTKYLFICFILNAYSHPFSTNFSSMPFMVI